LKFVRQADEFRPQSIAVQCGFARNGRRDAVPYIPMTKQLAEVMVTSESFCWQKRTHIRKSVRILFGVLENPDYHAIS
jgi:hypothetical protein